MCITSNYLLILPLQEWFSGFLCTTQTQPWFPNLCPFTGRGLFAEAPINKEDFVVEYRGEIIDFAESEKRRKIYPFESTVYFFDFFWKGNNYW